MKSGRFIKILSAILSVTAFVNTVSVFAEDNTSYTMKINENNVIKTVNRTMYGVNMEWSGAHATGLYLKPGTHEPEPTFVECYTDMFGLARMAGGSSQEFVWKNSLGDMSSRKEQTLWGLTAKTEFGVEEWLKAVKTADKNAKFVYVVNIVNDTYENMADVIEFLRSDGTVNYNGGENWGQVRINMGIKEPVDIFAFEIGNEVDLIGKEFSWYVEKVRTAISVIRSVDKTTPIAVHTSTKGNASTPQYSGWHRTLLQEFGDEIGYISTHYYYNVGTVTGLEKRISEISYDIQSMMGSDRVKVYTSEHAANRISSKADAGYDYVVPHTMLGTLNSAEFFLRMMWYPMIDSSTYHSTHSSSWCIGYRDEDGVMKPSGIGSLLRLFLDNGVGNVVESQFSGFEKLKKANVMGQAVKSEDGLNVILVNNSDKANTVEFTFNNRYSLEEYSYIQADDYKADNYIGTKGINVDTVKVESTDEITSYKMPKYSVTALRLKKMEGGSE